MEEWKPIKNYESRYAVSDQGRVWDMKANREVSQMTSGLKTSSGLYANLTSPCGDRSKRKLKIVSRLVAEAFISNPEGKPFVDHINRDRFNNKVDNLRWATRVENARNTRKSWHMQTEDGLVLVIEWCERFKERLKVYGALHRAFRNTTPMEETVLHYLQENKAHFCELL